MTVELKPCPFCGGSKVKTFGPYGWHREWGISHSCTTFYNGSSELCQGFRSEAAAVEAWNTRAPDPDHPTMPEIADRDCSFKRPEGDGL